MEVTGSGVVAGINNNSRRTKSLPTQLLLLLPGIKSYG